ncbi:Fic-domain-containing protein [Apiospora kogelbergensis]|uniref:Fic-domain-containing protein n=1 Tax=Apiospora kogelbergensis TaxID=1337665 RepID=UPI00312D5559
MSYSLARLQEWDLWEVLQPHMARLIYSSNFIEQAGSTSAITNEICQKIFAGQTVSATVSGDEYTKSEEALKSLNRPASATNVTQSRQEVINHAHALLYAFEHFVLDQSGFTCEGLEAFINQIHVVLCAGNVLDAEQAGSPGKYRTWLVGARHGDQKKAALFIRPEAVPKYMQALAMNMKGDMYMPLLDEDLPAIPLAAIYCHRFVCIHPFGDGNGRMCRIILNMILLKTAGLLSIFGGDEPEREKYLQIAFRGSKTFYKEDGEVPERKQTGHLELQEFVQEHLVNVKNSQDANKTIMIHHVDEPGRETRTETANAVTNAFI